MIAVAAVLVLGLHPARSAPARAAVTVTEAGHRFQSLSLARVDGSVTGVFMRLPAGGWWLASPNGRGDVLLTRVGEIYDIWPGGSRHIGGMLTASAHPACPGTRRAASVAEPDRDQERTPLSALPVVFSWRSGRYKHVKVL